MLDIKHIDYQSETTLCIYFSDSIHTQVALEIAQLSDLIRTRVPHLIEIIPSYTSIFIEYDVLRSGPQQLERNIHQLLSDFQYSPLASSQLELPVFYDPQVAPDLTLLAEKNNLTVSEVIQIHSEATYTVSSLGFAPGFAYLAGLDPRLATPRLEAPKDVAQGSLGIADHQTAIYPNSSPGGWSVIGSCPVKLFDLNNDPITPFQIGMKVKFTPITQQEFIQQGGRL